MKKFLLLIISVAVLVGCTSQESTDHMEEIKKLMANNDYVLLDVRTKEEYQESHLKDAINIPHNQINKNIDLSKEKIIFVYCKSGNRSKTAYDTLTELGYTVYDLGAMESIDLPKE